MEPPPTAMMAETQQYLEKIQLIADSALAEAALKSSLPSRKGSLTAPTAPSPRRVSLTTAFSGTSLATTTATDTGRPLMSTGEQAQPSTQVDITIAKDTQKQLKTQSEAQQTPATEVQRTHSEPEEGQSQLPNRPSMPKGESSNSSTESASSEMSDTKLSRFYHAMGSSESSAAERREAEERARKEAEERARQQSDGK